MTLTEFLLARIAEDEAEARALLAEWEASPPSAYDAAQVGWLDAGSPERVLADVEAKRRIVEQCRWIDVHPDWYSDPDLSGEFTTCEVVLSALAAIYRDHPDYRDEETDHG